MEIKSISIRRIKNEEKIKAICSVNFDNQFVVHGIRLVEGKEGYFLSFPAKIRNDNKYFDIAHPIDSDFRMEMTNRIVEEYNKKEIL